MAHSELKPDNNDDDMPPPSPLPFLAQDITLEVLPDPQQLSHGTTEHISTLPFRKCSISTKITDLRRCYFNDGKTGGKREACVVVFELEFGEQVRGSRQRITEMGIWVLVEEVDADDDEGGKDQSSTTINGDTKPVIQVPTPDLAIKALYPRSASGSLTERTITTSLTTSLTPSFNNISIGSLGITQEKSHVEPHWAQYTSTSAGSQGVKLSLSENELLKSGIPTRLRFAVLLQTDGLPFDVELKFKGAARNWGVKVGAKSVLRIGRGYLWFRRGEGEGNGEVRFDGDADSEGFKRWVVSKTGNAWAEGVEWE